MPHIFDADVITAVLRHMNGDHTDDNILIARAFAEPSDVEVTGSVMTGFDGDAGVWEITRDGEVADRPAVRREVVALYDAACARLGVEPRPHA